MVGMLANGEPGIVLIDFESAIRAGEPRTIKDQYYGNAYFASPWMLVDRESGWYFSY